MGNSGLGSRIILVTKVGPRTRETKKSRQQIYCRYKVFYITTSL